MKALQHFLSRNHFWLFVIAFISLLVFVENNNEKLWTNDFKVYYLAAIDFFKGNDPYIHNYGLDTGYFKYPPFTLFLFKPFTFFSYGVAQLIHLLLLTVSLCFSFYYTKKLATSLQIKFHKSALYLGFLFVAIHLVREFHMGNINLYLLALFLSGLYQNQKKNTPLSALFWSLMLILKPITILSLLVLVFYKEWKTILWMSGLGILFFLFPIITEGWNGNIDLWTGWFNSISSHGEYIVSENSLTYLANYYFGIESQWGPSFLFLVVLLSLFLSRSYFTELHGVFRINHSTIFIFPTEYKSMIRELTEV